MVKYIKTNSSSNWVVVFFDDKGYNPAGSDGVFYSPYKSKEKTISYMLSPDVVKHKRYPNFVVISYSDWDRMSGSNYEKLDNYIDRAIASGNYYTQDI